MRVLTKTFSATAVALSVIGLTQAPAFAESKFACAPGDTYIMNVMVSAHPYWVPVFEGFKQAAEAMGCEVVFSGTPDYDITKQIASFEQDLVKQPKGILLHPMQADPFIEPINRAIESGVAIVTFAADSPKSKRSLLHHLGQPRRGQVCGRGDRRTARRQGRVCGARESRPEQPRPARHRLHRLHGQELSGHEAGRPPGVEPGFQQGLPGDARDDPGQPEPRRALDPGSRLGRRRRGSQARGGVQGHHHACRRDATTLEQIKAGNIHKALNPNQGIQGYVGIHRHLPGRASRN